MHIEYFNHNGFMERSSIVWDKDGFCAFVDPGSESDEELRQLTDIVSSNNLKPVAIMLTHAHIDHVYGASALMKRFGVPVYMHEQEKYTLEVTNPFLCKTFGLKSPDDFTEGISLVKDGDIIKTGSLCFEVLETPGHSKGGICLLERNEKVLFSGDTLFAGAIGRTDHPGGDYDLLMKSIFEKLLMLEGDTRVIPGHGPETEIASERMTNPFLLPFNEPYED